MTQTYDIIILELYRAEILPNAQTPFLKTPVCPIYNQSEQKDQVESQNQNFHVRGLNLINTDLTQKTPDAVSPTFKT